MEAEITPSRIANSILQDKSFSGYYVLVEGKKDVKLYGRFVRKDGAKIRPTFGKYKQREVYKILGDRGFTQVIGIRDADYLRLTGNEKYDPNYAFPIFPTDCHDAELMMLCADTLPAYLALITEEEKVDGFERKVGKCLFDLLLDLLYPLACLRLANKQFSLGLSFKPERPEGNKLKINKFICRNEWRYLGDEIMINTVVEYSKNRGQDVATRDIVKEKLGIVLNASPPHLETVNGHDVSQLLLMISKDGLGSKNKLLQDSDCVEDLLIASFDLSKFYRTSLFASVSVWQEKEKVTLFD